jgi:asparagine synthase (glutamine-hydrolysing)
MSGIVGIVQFDGMAVEPRSLHDLTDFLTFRGPDAQHVWINKNVGLGHTLFKTTEESERDCQPLTLDNNTWIVADVRIDARDELISELKAAGEPDLAQSSGTDAELILSAYRAWGIHCVERLLGDFAFGIWDGAHQQLFCARDHMGVKPFYYARSGSCLVFSNTLECIRRHPLVSNRLNDLAMADFLLFGVNQDPATTSFAEIERLPPAHRLVCSRDGVQLSRYWSMPIDEPVFYRRPDDYTDQFRELLRASVGDRLRTNQVWIFMSGGLDSPTLAACAGDLLRRRYHNFDIQAITKADEFNPEERRYAALVSQHLGMPVRFHEWTRGPTSFQWERLPFRVPEPCANAWIVPQEHQFWKDVSPRSRVFFYGEGPDNALRLDWRAYFRFLLEKGAYGQLGPTIIRTLLADRHVPFLRRLKRRINGNHLLHVDFPIWLNKRLESRFCLRDRWCTFKVLPSSSHPLRSEGYGSLQNPLWQTLFEGFDPGSSNLAFEVRYPFSDIRMLRYLLSVPALPWCRSKYLLRRAMRSDLPAALLRRAKTGAPVIEMSDYLRQFVADPFVPCAQLETYVDLGCTEINRLNGRPGVIWDNLRLRSLNHWLQYSWPSLDNIREETVFDGRVGRP